MEKYEAVIGLEIHIQLLTESKIFSSDKNKFGSVPNTNVSAVSLGHPGTLPRLNKKVIESAVKLGIACHCKITERNKFARKNYFYADLPKGYQISQYTTPICTGGFVEIKNTLGKQPTTNNQQLRIHLTRIHIEEDAGKSIHDIDPFYSLIDLNRAGVPLLEMVTEPEIYSGEQAYRFLTEVRKLVRHLEICDGNMEEGSMRCDANISVKLIGEKKLGTKVEVKNMNSIRNVQRAIQHEAKRQIDLIENGVAIKQDTRSFDAASGTTFSVRSKELAHDYRYFPEPDLLPVLISKEYISKIEKQLPPLPNQLYEKYVKEYNLSDYDAGVLTDDKNISNYFEEVVSELKKISPSPTGKVGMGLIKSAANWVMGAIKSYLNENEIDTFQFTVKPEKIAQLIFLIEDGKVSNSAASQKIFPIMIRYPEKTAEQIAKENNLIQQSDEDFLNELVKKAIEKYPEKVAEYRAGKKGLVGLFMSEAMKLSNGKADPKIANKLLVEMLKKKI